MNLGFLSSPNRWAYFMASLLFALTAGYIAWHLRDKPGSKNVMLSQSEQADIQNILDGAALLGDSAKSDTVEQGVKPKGTSTSKTSFKTQREYVYKYITQTHTMLDSAANEQLRLTLSIMPDEQSLRNYLSTHPVRVYSPFHLNGRSLLWELICWALFGVFCNLFYRVSEAYKGTEVKTAASSDTPADAASSEEVELVLPDTNRRFQDLTTTERLQRRLLGGFDPAEVPSHLAKLLYTPFLVVIIYLALISFNGTTDLQWVQYGEGVIVFAFIIGFFSGRMVDLLERIKDLILPVGRFGNEPPAAGPAGVNNNPDRSAETTDSLSFNNHTSDFLSARLTADDPLPLPGFAALKLKYRLELDKPDRRLSMFTIGVDDFATVVQKQADSTKLIYSNEKLADTLNVISNDIEGTPGFFRVFVQLRILRGDSIPDPAADCFLFLSFIDPDTNTPVAFPQHTPNPRKATLVFKMPASGIISVHEDVLWKQPPAPQPVLPQPPVES